MDALTMYDFLIDHGITRKDILTGAILMGGLNTNTMEAVLFYHTGYRDFISYLSDMEEGE